MAASVEALSEHPLAKAIVAYSKQENIEYKPVTDFSMIPGKGVKAQLGTTNILCGNAKWLEELNVKFGDKAYETLGKVAQSRKGGHYDCHRK
jgi:Cation transport ATPase